MRGLASLLVVRYDGSLKAEHGSGRNMAPFVRDEWGAAAYALMRRVKELLDPDGILNPGVVLTDDPEAHLRHLKALPAVAPVVDALHRVRVLRAALPVARPDAVAAPAHRGGARDGRALEASGDRATAASLRDDFAYEGDATCAGDSMCATSCPVAIDTGVLVKADAGRGTVPSARRLADWTARHLDVATAAARAGLRLARVLRALPLADARARRGHGDRARAGPVRRATGASGAGAAARRGAARASPPETVRPSCASVRASRGCWARCRASPEPVTLPELLARAGFAVVEPADAGRALLRHAVREQGPSGRGPRRGGARRSTRSGAPRTAAGSRW